MRVISNCTVSGRTIWVLSCGQDDSYPAFVSLQIIAYGENRRAVPMWNHFYNIHAETDSVEILYSRYKDGC